VGILRYLCREKGVADHWYPKDSKQQARVDEYLEWQHLNTRANCALYFRAKVQLKLNQYEWVIFINISCVFQFLLPMISGNPPDEKMVAKRMRDMLVTLDKLETVWLKDNKPFLTGDKISIADILGACEIEQPRK
jgi:glutathione S-transferase